MKTKFKKPFQGLANCCTALTHHASIPLRALRRQIHLLLLAVLRGGSITIPILQVRKLRKGKIR